MSLTDNETSLTPSINLFTGNQCLLNIFFLNLNVTKYWANVYIFCMTIFFFKCFCFTSSVEITIFSTEEKYVSHRNCVCCRMASISVWDMDRTTEGTWNIRVQDIRSCHRCCTGDPARNPQEFHTFRNRCFIPFNMLVFLEIFILLYTMLVFDTSNQLYLHGQQLWLLVSIHQCCYLWKYYLLKKCYGLTEIISTCTTLGLNLDSSNYLSHWN